MPRRRGTTLQARIVTTFSYDAASGPVSFLQGTGVTTLTWSPRGVLTQELRADGSIATYVHSSVRNQLVYAQPSPGTNSSYTYDADGMRLRALEGGVWATMVWDSSAGGGGDYLAVNRSGADDSLFVLMDGEALGEILGSEARDYLADPLGSVRGGFDSSQDLRDPVSYWPYGERLLSLSPPWGTLFWLGALGYYQDPGTRSYVRARSYDQNLGAWLQVDPLWPNEPGFGYVGGRPVTAVDPSGRLSQLRIDCPPAVKSWIQKLCGLLSNIDDSRLSRINGCIKRNSRGGGAPCSPLTKEQLNCMKGYCRGGDVKCFKDYIDGQYAGLFWGYSFNDWLWGRWPPIDISCGGPGSNRYDRHFQDIFAYWGDLRINLRDIALIWFHELGHACNVAHGAGRPDDWQCNDLVSYCVYGTFW